MRLLYSAVWWIAMPLVLLRLWYRARKEPGYGQHVGQRLGFYRQSFDPATHVIWVHAVSVGETRAAEPLVDAVLANYPGHVVLMTHMTATGRAAGAQLFAKYSARVVQSYLPYDTGWMCERFLRHFNPAVCILMETEVWPNLVRQCRRFGVPVMLANARLSARSLRRGRRFAALLTPAAQAITCVAAQSEADAARLREFGARHVEVTGSLKFDVQVPVGMVALGQQWKQAVGARKVVLCASTREGEEVLILDALRALGRRDWLLVMVPRHPQRFDEVAELMRSYGLSVRRRSECRGSADLAGIDAVLGDSMGEMFAYFATCELAFIGGSLLPMGGQSPIEAFALGKPVLVGPHTFNFTSITESAVASQAALRIGSAEDMLAQAVSLLDDPARLAAMGGSALDFAQQHRGATGKTLALLQTLLAQRV